MKEYEIVKIDKTKFEEDVVISLTVGHEKTFDMEVDENHHYLLENGVISHNSITEIVEAGGGGVEPIFAKYFVRRERATTEKWKEWFTFNHLVRQFFNDHDIEITKENTDLLDADIWVTAHDVNNRNKIDLMSVIQKYIDSAISITYNVNKDATPKDIENIYLYAWEQGIKNVSVFREGSKQGVLITDANYNDIKNKEIQQSIDANRFSPKRPEFVECDIYQITVNKEPHIVLVGIIEGKPYEVFVTKNIDKEFNLLSYKKGALHKKKQGYYNLIVYNGDDKVIIENLIEKFDTVYGTLSRFISMSLRHKVPIDFIVDQLAKDKNFISFEKSVGRILKKYIKENTLVKTSEVCPVCQSSQLMYKEGCKTCVSCGWGKCD